MTRYSTIVVALLAIECRSPTQIKIELATDACGEEISVDVTGAHADASGSAPSLTTRECMGTVVLVPGAEGTVVVTVTQGRGKPAEACAHPTPGDRSCVVARRRVSYVDHTPLRLPISLTSDCAGVVCDSTSTCVHGACVSATVDPTCTTLETCTDPDAGLDASTPPDATTPDASVPDTGTVDAGAPTLVTGVAGLTAIAASGGRVYYASSSLIGWVGTKGNGSGFVTATHPYTTIALSPTQVFLGSAMDGFVFEFPLDLSKTNNTLSFVPSALAYEGVGNTFWIASTSSSRTGRFDAANINNVVAEKTFSAVPRGLAAASGSVCWAVDAAPNNTNSGISCVTNTAQQVVSDGQLRVGRAVAMNSTRAFVSHVDGDITSVTVPVSGPPNTLIAGHAATSMVASDTTLYWMDPNGDVYRFPLPSGPAARVEATGTLSIFQSLALDATALYAVDAAGDILVLPL